MSDPFSTEQEAFWAGRFGDEYLARNAGGDLIAARKALWTAALARADNIQSICEFGANIGLNLIGLRQSLPTAHLSAIEINPQAVARLAHYDWLEVFAGSILTPQLPAPVDLTFTCGVLIHIAPDALDAAYQNLYDGSRRYIAIAEYYNPTPVTVPYRGHADRLFKRDFAGDMLERFSDLRLCDYGFRYHRDPTHPVDDLTWFLMEKT